MCMAEIWKNCEKFIFLDFWPLRVTQPEKRWTPFPVWEFISSEGVWMQEIGFLAIVVEAWWVVEIWWKFLVLFQNCQLLEKHPVPHKLLDHVAIPQKVSSYNAGKRPKVWRRELLWLRRKANHKYEKWPKIDEISSTPTLAYPKPSFLFTDASRSDYEISTTEKDVRKERGRARSERKWSGWSGEVDLSKNIMKNRQILHFILQHHSKEESRTRCSFWQDSGRCRSCLKRFWTWVDAVSMTEESMEVDDDKIEMKSTSLASVTEARQVVEISSSSHFKKKVLSPEKAAEGLETDGKSTNK